VRIAFGVKSHSGWAALVAVGGRGGRLDVVDRCRLELVEEHESKWAKQPYHAAEGLKAGEARALVKRGIESARRTAVRELRGAIARARGAEHEVVACGILMGAPMPAWSVEEILAVHFRMHKAEGVLFREALARAAEECGVKPVTVPEKVLESHAEEVLDRPWVSIQETVAALGKPLGAPWGKDQKEAAVAAMIALRGER